MELQGRYESLKRQGLNLVALTYDDPAIVERFAAEKGITFPLLADKGSAVIERYGLLNESIERSHRFYGVPHPGTFVLDRDLKVVARFFEQSYRIRNTFSSIAVKLGEPVGGVERSGTQISTAHLDALAYATDAVVAPGTKFSLVLDVTPRPGMHIYAPPQTEYRAIALKLDPIEDVTFHAVPYPESEVYVFEPLDERVDVYMKPFRLVQDVTVEVTDGIRARSKAPDAALALSGVLEYQACDDRICYPPEEVPVRWVLAMKPLEQ